jgi:Ca-activated chloride channel family protein
MNLLPLPQFSSPWLLCAFPAIVGLLLWSLRHSLAQFPRPQRIASCTLRSLFLLLLLLALAGLQAPIPVRELSVLFAVDHSLSVSQEASEQARNFLQQCQAARNSADKVGLVSFASKAQLLLPASEAKPAHIPTPSPDPQPGTHLAEALQFCHALFPENSQRRLVLLSDGNETSPGALAAAANLAANGIQISTIPLHNPSHPEVLVEKVLVPRRLKSGEPFDLTATLRSSQNSSAKVRVYQNQFLIETREVALTAGSQEFKLPNLRPDSNFTTYEVEVESASDTLPQNNRSQAIATLRGEPSVLIIESDESKARPLAETLRREKIRVQTRSPLGLPSSLEELQAIDLLILSDVSSLSLGRERMELYRRWVQNFGGGFLMLGGENSFGVGGYFRTPIEQLLPVRMEHESRQDIPSVALLLVLDRSGSMSATVQGQTKMSLANQGAALALGVLQPRDYFGVLAVDTRAHTVAPLQQHSSKGATEQKILSVTAGGGGIYIYTSLTEAAQTLRDIPARIKHVILFSDAADAEEKSAGELPDGIRGSGSALELATTMAASRISTSVVALGSEADKDTAFLRELAERGNGRFYLTSDATSLPQIFTTETMKVAQSSLVEEPFLPVPSAPHPLLNGIDWPQAPLLLGYNSTKPKPSADILLATERGEPLLALWRYGLGHAAAFTSDAKSRWASEWLSWPGYSQFWTQLVRAILRHSEDASLQVQASPHSDQLDVQIDAFTPEGAFRNQISVSVSTLSSAPSEQPNGITLQAQQIAPGRYHSQIPIAPNTTTLLRVSSPQLPEGGYDFGHTTPVSEEFLQFETNTALLKQIALVGKGSYNPSPEEIFRRPETPQHRAKDLAPALLISAMGLFLADLWIRRRTWKQPQQPLPDVLKS